MICIIKKHSFGNDSKSFHLADENEVIYLEIGEAAIGWIYTLQINSLCKIPNFDTKFLINRRTKRAIRQASYKPYNLIPTLQGPAQTRISPRLFNIIQTRLYGSDASFQIPHIHIALTGHREYISIINLRIIQLPDATLMSIKNPHDFFIFE